jgi:hypothetical protein
MRRQLKKEEGQRKKFLATFVKLGKKTNYLGYSEETILLKDIIDADTQRVVADHLWFAYTKTFQQVRLKEGMLIEFEARVTPYKKGYVNRRYNIDKRTTDYRLSRPTKICPRER